MPRTLVCSPLALVAVAAAAFAALVSSARAWETESQAAQQVRHLLASPEEHFGSGVLSTVYPASSSGSATPGKGPLPNAPLSGPEYFAPCFPNGDLALLALPVSQNWRNALSPGANVTLSVGSNPDPRVPDWRHLEPASASHHSARQWDPSRPSWRRGMPSKLRTTLFGHVSEITSPDEIELVRNCFVGAHPDAKYWMPGSRDSPHAAKWVKLEVASVYAVGGFGDEHRIGWIDRAVYAQSGEDHVDAATLPSLEVDVLFGENAREAETRQARGSAAQLVFSS